MVQPTQGWIESVRDLRATLRDRGYSIREEAWLDDNGERHKINGRRYLCTLLADRAETVLLADQADAAPSELELLVGRSCDDAARRDYVRHHAAWLEEVLALPPAAPKRQLAEIWLPLLREELSREWPEKDPAR